MKEKADVTRPADTAYEIDPVLAGRWSSRAIDPDQQVEEEVVHRLLEAARWAPSSLNNQPWSFLVLTEAHPEALEAGRNALMPGNSWAINAPVLIYSLAHVNFRGKTRENWRRGYETGMAVISMAYQAVREGLVFHQMAGYSSATLRESFSISKDFDIFTAIAVGYPGRKDLLGEDKLKMETQIRERLDSSEFVRWGSW